MKLQYVDEFKERNRWNRLDGESIHVIEEHLSALPNPESINEVARRFDLMMLKMMEANLLMSGRFGKYKDSLIGIGDQLSKKYSIPQVEAKKVWIENIQEPKFYEGIRQRKMEQVREEIRDLIQYLDGTQKVNIYTCLLYTSPSPRDRG